MKSPFGIKVGFIGTLTKPFEYRRHALGHDLAISEVKVMGGETEKEAHFFIPLQVWGDAALSLVQMKEAVVGGMVDVNGVMKAKLVNGKVYQYVAAKKFAFTDGAALEPIKDASVEQFKEMYKLLFMLKEKKAAIYQEAYFHIFGNMISEVEANWWITTLRKEVSKFTFRQPSLFSEQNPAFRDYYQRGVMGVKEEAGKVKEIKVEEEVRNAA